MIPPIVFQCLAYAPFVIMLLCAYWFVFWFMPAMLIDDFGIGWGTYVKGAIYSHLFLLFLLWLAWGISWIGSNTNKEYNKKYKALGELPDSPKIEYQQGKQTQQTQQTQQNILERRE